MNWNGQRETLNHLINVLGEPNTKAATQAEFNARRRAKVQSALNVRPVFMPLEFSMAAAGMISPYRDTTESLGYDVIITGIKSDVQTRSIIVRRTEDEKPIAYVGEEQSLFLRADDLAGITAAVGGGQTGTFYLPSPIHLPAGNRITVEMFKTDATVDAEEANIVLIGVRVFNKGLYTANLLDRDEIDKIDQIIKMRDLPRVVFLKQDIEFSSAIAGGEARNKFTPQVEEPLLIRGVRTTLRQSIIELGLEGEPRWTVKPTPIWAVAGEDELIHDNYNWFPRPIFLHSRNTIHVERVVNSIDGSLIDDRGLTVGTNTITWICETV